MRPNSNRLLSRRDFFFYSSMKWSIINYVFTLVYVTLLAVLWFISSPDPSLMRNRTPQHVSISIFFSFFLRMKEYLTQHQINSNYLLSHLLDASFQSFVSFLLWQVQEITIFFLQIKSFTRSLIIHKRKEKSHTPPKYPN